MKIRSRLVLCIALAVVGSTQAAAEPLAISTLPTPEQQTDKRLIERFFDDTLHSSNMRLRLMRGSSGDPSADDLSGKTFTPIDELADLTKGSTDPMVLALLIEPCNNDRLRPKPTCDALDLATRLTVADTQNQVAWLSLSSTLRWRGDLSGSRAAFERAANASMWHEYFDDGSRVIAAAVPVGLSPRVRAATLQIALTTPMAQLLPHSALATLSFHCKDPTLFDACVRIINTIARDSGSLLSSQIAIAVGKRTGIDASVIEMRTRSLDALRGASMRQFTRDWSEITDAAELEALIKRIERRIKLGEMASLRATLAECGLSEAAAANEYRQYIAALIARSKAESVSRGERPE